MGPETLGCVDPQVVPKPPGSHHHGIGFPEDRVGSSCAHTHTRTYTLSHGHTRAHTLQVGSRGGGSRPLCSASVPWPLARLPRQPGAMWDVTRPQPSFLLGGDLQGERWRPGRPTVSTRSEKGTTFKGGPQATSRTRKGRGAAAVGSAGPAGSSPYRGYRRA